VDYKLVTTIISVPVLYLVVVWVVLMSVTLQLVTLAMALFHFCSITACKEVKSREGARSVQHNLYLADTPPTRSQAWCPVGFINELDPSQWKLIFMGLVVPGSRERLASSIPQGLSQRSK